MYKLNLVLLYRLLGVSRCSSTKFLGGVIKPKTQYIMKNLVAGHTYELSNFENKDEKGQVLQFIHKEPIEEGSTELKTVSDGTTNEEVLEALINRMNFLNGKFPCRENSIVITHLETALLWLEKRTNDRIKRNVEGKNEK